MGQARRVLAGNNQQAKPAKRAQFRWESPQRKAQAGDSELHAGTILTIEPGVVFK